MSAHSEASNSTSASLQAAFSDVRKRRTQHPNMTTATNGSEKNDDTEASSDTSAAAPDEQPLLPKSANLASEEAKKQKPKPPMLNLSIRNVYYTDSPSGKASIGSPGSPNACDLM